jgi:hypothetical protein
MWCAAPFLRELAVNDSANPTALRTTLGHTLEGELTRTISQAPRVSGDESRGKRSLGSRIVKT